MPFHGVMARRIQQKFMMCSKCHFLIGYLGVIKTLGVKISTESTPSAVFCPSTAPKSRQKERQDMACPKTEGFLE